MKTSKAKAKSQPTTKPKAAGKKTPAATKAKKSPAKAAKKATATATKAKPTPSAATRKSSKAGKDPAASAKKSSAARLAPPPPPPPPLEAPEAQRAKVHAPPPPRPIGSGSSKRHRKRQPTGPGKPPRPTMPWPTGTSTAGLRVASAGVLPPRTVTPPPPPPTRKIVDAEPLGRIVGVNVTETGVQLTIEGNRRLLLRYTVFGPEDINRVEIGAEGTGIVFALRNGESLEYSLVRIRALAATLDERREGEK